MFNDGGGGGGNGGGGAGSGRRDGGGGGSGCVNKDFSKAGKPTLYHLDQGEQ